MKPDSVSAGGLGFHRHQLVSLWEFMKPFVAKNHLEAIQNLSQFKEVFKDETDQISVEDRKRFTNSVEMNWIRCKEDNLASPGDQLERMLKLLHHSACTYKLFGEMCEEFVNRLIDALKRRTLLQLSDEETLHYEKHSLGWETVTANFPSAVLEIEEANKCFSLGRYTACVFHCMRCFEPAIKAVSAAVGVTGYVADWGTYIRKIDEAVHVMWPNRADQTSRAAQDRYSEILVRLGSLKDAFRNPTMHKPERVYTEEMAREVLAHTRAFMINVARDHTEQP